MFDGTELAHGSKHVSCLQRLAQFEEAFAEAKASSPSVIVVKQIDALAAASKEGNPNMTDSVLKRFAYVLHTLVSDCDRHVHRVSQLTQIMHLMQLFRPKPAEDGEVDGAKEDSFYIIIATARCAPGALPVSGQRVYQST